MKDFLFKSPTKVKFGAGISFQLYEIFEEMGAKKPFFVTGKHVGKTDEFAKIIASLEEKGYSVQLFTDTQPDPPIDVCDAAAQVLKDSGCDVCVAVGGGSVIDTAKAMCMLVTNEGSVKEYLFGGSKTVENPSLPLIVVPTTAGSGSEVSAASVITDEENDIKLSVSHEYLMPKFAVIDPLQQLHMPAFITATTGMDALTHAIESYVSLNANPFSDAYGEMAIRLIGENIRTAVHNPLNLEARCWNCLCQWRSGRGAWNLAGNGRCGARRAWNRQFHDASVCDREKYPRKSGKVWKNRGTAWRKCHRPQ